MAHARISLLGFTAALVLITLGAAEERHGIDIQFEPVPVASVEGIVSGPTGPSNALVVLMTADYPRGRVGEFVRTSRAGSGGEFRFVNVPPGEYHLSVRADGYSSRRTEVVVGATPVTLELTIDPELHYEEVVSVGPLRARRR